jgi:hypothetical protein
MTILLIVCCVAATAARAATTHHRETLARWRNADGTIPAEARWTNPVNRNLLRIARCETGYLAGGKPNWRHHNSTYSGALGFAHSTWSSYKHYVKPMPRARWAYQASPAEQLAVARVLVRIWPNYSSWPACSIRLGLR